MLKTMFARPLRFIANAAIFAFANLFGFILSRLNDRAFYACVRGLAAIFSAFDKRRKCDCLNNLDFAYGGALSGQGLSEPRLNEQGLNEEEKQKILHRAYKNFAFVILNALRLLFMDKNAYLARFKSHRLNLLEEAAKNGNFIVLTAHYGDWEATARFIAAAFSQNAFSQDKLTPKHKLTVVGRLTQFSAINALMERSRQTFGAAFLDKNGAAKHLVRTLKTPHNAIGLVIDHHITPSEGIFVRFFGHEVTHSTSASILAKKFNLPLLFVRTTLSEDYSCFEIFFDVLFDPKKQDYKDATIAEITQLQASFTEQIIRQKPEEWFWFHKRFKAKHSEIYTYK